MLKYIYSPEYLASQLPEESLNYIEAISASRYNIKVVFKPGCATYIHGKLVTIGYFRTLAEFKEFCEPRLLKLAKNGLEKELSSIASDTKRKEKIHEWNATHKRKFVFDEIEEIAGPLSIRSGKEFGSQVFKSLFTTLSDRERREVIEYVNLDRDTRPRLKDTILRKKDLNAIMNSVIQQPSEEKKEPAPLFPKEILKEAIKYMEEGLKTYDLSLALLNEKISPEIISKCLEQGKEIFTLKTQELINLSQKKGVYHE